MKGSINKAKIQANYLQNIMFNCPTDEEEGYSDNESHNYSLETADSDPDSYPIYIVNHTKASASKLKSQTKKSSDTEAKKIQSLKSKLNICNPTFKITSKFQGDQYSEPSLLCKLKCRPLATTANGPSNNKMTCYIAHKGNFMVALDTPRINVYNMGQKSSIKLIKSIKVDGQISKMLYIEKARKFFASSGGTIVGIYTSNYQIFAKKQCSMISWKYLEKDNQILTLGAFNRPCYWSS